jgi:hypothetical protein
MYCELLTWDLRERDKVAIADTVLVVIAKEAPVPEPPIAFEGEGARVEHVDVVALGNPKDEFQLDVCMGRVDKVGVVRRCTIMTFLSGYICASLSTVDLVNCCSVALMSLVALVKIFAMTFAASNAILRMASTVLTPPMVFVFRR